MEPESAQNGPYLMELKAGKYSWCSCGHSSSQPFCNGSHEKLKSGMTPVETVITNDTVVAWCGCKRTGTPPFCDRMHKDL